MTQKIKPKRGGARAGIAAALAAGLLAACGGGSGTEGATALQATATTMAADSDATATAEARSAQALGRKSATTPTAVAQPKNTEGRLLASNCFQCHGTMGTGGFDGIRGKEAGEVLEFLRKPAGRDIMAAHAQGYTAAQLQKIIAYLQQ